MMRSCVTLSLVPEARGGPFVFWDDLPSACQKARELGFDAIEIFAPSAQSLNAQQLRQWLDEHGLRLAALGTGAGWVRQRLSLSNADASIRQRACDFVRSLVDLAGQFSASAIIGSMQGRYGDGITRNQALAFLAESLQQLGEHAAQYAVPLLFEPLNRYETNLVNSVADGLRLLQSVGSPNVKLLCDLFHMNIEEENLAAALRSAGQSLGHIHLVDSNRRPAGCGHIDYRPIAAALREIHYSGYLSAEALPYPDSDQAARLTMDAYRRFFLDYNA
ncbi:MAG TPA: sugar phosphate isomerase/epimerase family protein [Tepidisphaeraceae bacterium]|nr:sugar phosphate isomerase/epimerase family protein [Tepidisphaeraceae bacterium]